MADVHDAVVGCVDVREAAVSHLLGQGAQGGNLNVGLDFVERVAMLRLANAQSVVAEGGEASI